MPKNRSSQATKRLTVCAMLSALGVILLWIGSMIEVVDISMAVIASLLCVFAVIEYGGGAPWMVFATTSVLSLILLSHNRAPAFMYLLFFGYYPILKEKLEKKPRVLAWILKEVIFNVALAILLVLTHFLLYPGATLGSMLYFYAVLALAAEVIFPIYDVALTRLITFYLFRLRKRFRIK